MTGREKREKKCINLNKMSFSCENECLLLTLARLSDVCFFLISSVTICACALCVNAVLARHILYVRLTNKTPTVLCIRRVSCAHTDNNNLFNGRFVWCWPVTISCTLYIWTNKILLSIYITLHY